LINSYPGGDGSTAVVLRVTSCLSEQQEEIETPSVPERNPENDLKVILQRPEIPNQALYDELRRYLLLFEDIVQLSDNNVRLVVL
jgi:hypothetical protein